MCTAASIPGSMKVKVLGATISDARHHALFHVETLAVMHSPQLMVARHKQHLPIR